MEADLKTFKEIVFSLLNKHAPMKRKYVRANEAPFMKKELYKAIMRRSKLRNQFLKNKNEINRKKYKVQRNYCKKLLKTTKKQYINNLNTSKVTENGTFRKKVLPLWPFGNLGIGISASFRYWHRDRHFKVLFSHYGFCW